MKSPPNKNMVLDHFLLILILVLFFTGQFMQGVLPRVTVIEGKVTRKYSPGLRPSGTRKSRRLPSTSWAGPVRRPYDMGTQDSSTRQNVGIDENCGQCKVYTKSKLDRTRKLPKKWLEHMRQGHFTTFVGLTDLSKGSDFPSQTSLKCLAMLFPVCQI